MEKYKKKLTESKMFDKIIYDEEVIEAILAVVEDYYPDFIAMALSDEQKKNLVKMIVSDKFKFIFISGEFDDPKDMKKLEKHKASMKTFNIEDNMGQFTAIFYK